MISLNTKQFLNVLKVASHVIDTRSSLPILSCVCLDWMDGKMLKIKTTDLDTYFQQEMPIPECKPGSACVSAKVLREIVGEWGRTMIDIAPGEDGHIEIKRDDLQSYSLVTVPADEFPPAPENIDIPLLSMPTGKLRASMLVAEKAVLKEASNPILSGMLMEVEGKAGLLHLVSTDTHRLIVAHAECASPTSDNWNLIVPRPALVRKLLGSGGSEMHMDVDSHHLNAKFTSTNDIGRMSVTTCLMEGHYPNYRKVLPKAEGKVARFQSQEMKARLNCLMAIASNNGEKVILSFSKIRVRLMAESSELGTGDEVKSVASEYEGVEDFKIAFNGRYLTDYLDVCHGRVAMKMNGELNPAVLLPIDDDNRHLMVVMPMKI